MHIFYVFIQLFIRFLSNFSGILSRARVSALLYFLPLFQIMDFDFFHHEEVVDATPAPRPPAPVQPAHPYADAIHISPPISAALQADPALLNAAVRCVVGSKASGTVRGYSRTLKSFQEFCVKNQISYPDFSAQDVIQYILHLDANNISFSFLASVKPAIQFLEQTLDRASIFSGAVEVVLEGARRRAEKRRGPREKAPQLSRSDITTMLNKLLLPHLHDPRLIPLVQFRTIFRIVIVYHTACRFDCFSRLRAMNFERSGDNIVVTFPSAKNDQHHQGNRSVLAAAASPYCPVRITVLFFRRFGLQFGSAAADRSFVNFQSRCAGSHQIRPILSSSLSYSEATKTLRSTFAAAGIQTKATDKSVKMLAVTSAYASGATAEQVMHLGRWASVSTPEHYKVNSEDFKISISRLVPALSPDILPN